MAVSVSLVLGADEALVLHAYLGRINAEGAAVIDQSEQRVLWDLEAMLEVKLVVPLQADYATSLSDARDRVRDAAGS